MAINPFSTSPNPNCLHKTASVRTVIVKTKFVLENARGITCVLGEYGNGKSQLCRYLYNEFEADADHYITDLITTPVFASEFAMVKEICQNFGLPAKRSLAAQMGELQAFLIQTYKDGKKAILFIDEANRLKSRDLEMLRAMLNWETSEQRLISIALFGSPQLRQLILKEENRPLYTRVEAPSTLDPMTLDEVQGLIEVRQQYYDTAIPFTADAYKQLYLESNGVPRICLKIAGLAVKLMEMTGQSAIDGELIESSAKESRIEE